MSIAKSTKKILIVDDDTNDRQAIRLCIEELEYANIQVTECKDVDSGIQQMKAINPDAVILDLHMPNKNGFDFMDIIHEDKRLSKAKIIMMTADDTLANVFKAEGKGIGAYHFIGKPFNIADLQALVLRLLFPVKAQNLTTSKRYR